MAAGYPTHVPWCHIQHPFFESNWTLSQLENRGRRHFSHKERNCPRWGIKSTTLGLVFKLLSYLGRLHTKGNNSCTQQLLFITLPGFYIKLNPISISHAYIKPTNKYTWNTVWLTFHGAMWRTITKGHILMWTKLVCPSFNGRSVWDITTEIHIQAKSEVSYFSNQFP